ncbi:ribonuclease H-like domain-containing protein, partial [Lactarius deliciosus]
MQISTRDEDWIVDPFELRNVLEVFTNPSIVKVLHGDNSDVVWLQEDFDLYSVNMFDTFHVSRVLDFPRCGLAVLLVLDKRYPQIDRYRSNVRVLLYIYDNLRNALLNGIDVQDVDVRRREQRVLYERSNHVPWIQVN